MVAGAIGDGTTVKPFSTFVTSQIVLTVPVVFLDLTVQRISDGEIHHLQLGQVVAQCRFIGQMTR